MATATASASSSTSDVDDAVGAPARSSGPTSSGGKTPRPPPSIIAGPPMPIVEFLVAMITSQQPRSAALPAKQRPELMPTSGTTPLSLPEDMEGHGVEAGHRLHVGVARPPAAAFGEEHQRQCAAARRSRTGGPSCGGWSCPGCRPARCSRRCATATRRFSAPNSVAVDAADAGDQAVGRRLLDQVVDACGACAGGDHERRRTRRSCPDRPGRRCSPAPCAGRSCAGAPPASGRLSSSVSAWRSKYLGQVGADVVEVDLLLGRRAPAPRPRPPRRTPAHGPRRPSRRPRPRSAARCRALGCGSRAPSSWLP